MLFLPYHQGRDVAERTERPAGVRRYHNIDTAQDDKSPVAATNRHDDCCHKQRRRQVIGDRRHNKSDKAGYPEQFAQRKTLCKKPGTQHIEYATLIHGVDVGHRGKQEEKQLDEFKEAVAHQFLDYFCLTELRVGHSDQHPDKSRGNHHGLRFPEMNGLLADNEYVCDREDNEGQDSGPVCQQFRRYTWRGRHGR